MYNSLLFLCVVFSLKFLYYIMIPCDIRYLQQHYVKLVDTPTMFMFDWLLEKSCIFYSADVV